MTTEQAAEIIKVLGNIETALTIIMVMIALGIGLYVNDSWNGRK